MLQEPSLSRIEPMLTHGPVTTRGNTAANPSLVTDTLKSTLGNSALPERIQAGAAIIILERR